MQTLRRYIIACFILLFVSNYVDGQTCCSGGVPVSNNLGLPAGSNKTFQLSFNYDLNVLNTQKTGTERQDRPESFRRTHTWMLQTGYSFTERFSIDAFIPFIRQERRSNVNNAKETTNGIGDLIVLFKYQILRLHQQQTLWTIGLAPELPTGKTSFRNSFGNVLLADLQPGSGSWDLLFWSQLTQTLPKRSSMSFFVQGLYKINGKHNDFGVVPFTTTYQFGNEFQLITGLSDRVLVGKNLFDFALSLRYRNAANDRSKPNSIPQALTQVPSTGGSWVFINPSVGYLISTNLSFNFNIEFPLYANIGGTQVTPTYHLNTGILYRFDKR